MIEGNDILYFSADDWGCGSTTSQTHIATTLAKKNRILYINSVGLRKPTVSASDVGRIFEKAKKFYKGLRQVEENIWVFTPIVIPFHQSKFFQKINKFLMVRYINYYRRKLKMKCPIFWSFLPNHVQLIGKFNESTVIYYCVDEYSEFEGVPTQVIREMERKMIGQADFVFTTSRALYENKRNGNPNTYYIPHGVHIEHFGKALSPDTPIPADIEAIPHPIIGFYGLIETWLDLDLIKQLAEKRPQWSFVLIGNANVDVSQIQNIRNVYLLGRRDYMDLPGYNKAFDVAIIPFVRNELTRNVNPIKLREYLAAGSPVVTTHMPEIEQYRAVIAIAGDYDAFLDKIEVMLTKKTAVDIQKRLDSVRCESWQARMDQLSKIL